MRGLDIDELAFILKDKKEDEQMRSIADALRRSVYANGGNCLKPDIGSEQDRLYSKTVAKGYLARVRSR